MGQPESRTVKSAGDNGLPGNGAVLPLQRIRVPGQHLCFQLVLYGGDLRFHLRLKIPKLSQIFNLGVQFVNAHKIFFPACSGHFIIQSALHVFGAINNLHQKFHS